MKKPTILLIAITFVIYSNYGVTQSNTTYLEIMKYADPDVVINQRPVSMVSVKSENSIPIFVFEQRGSTTKDNFILYQDGTIYWRPDWQEVTATETFRIVRNNETGELLEPLHGPYFSGKVSLESVEAFHNDIVLFDYCTDPGYSYLFSILTNPPQSDSIFKYNSNGCSFGLYTRFDHVSPSEFPTPKGKIDRNGKNDEEILAEMHPRIRRSYETHQFLKNKISDMIQEATQNESIIEVGFIEMKYVRLVPKEEALE
jgi:hypothetical protein